MQSRRMSVLETVVGTGIGYCVAVAANWLVLPHYGMEASLGASAEIGAIFTALALVRGYVVRRLFNALHRKGTGQWM